VFLFQDALHSCNPAEEEKEKGPEPVTGQHDRSFASFRLFNMIAHGRYIFHEHGAAPVRLPKFWGSYPRIPNLGPKFYTAGSCPLGTACSLSSISY